MGSRWPRDPKKECEFVSNKNIAYKENYVNSSFRHLSKAKTVKVWRLPVENINFASINRLWS